VEERAPDFFVSSLYLAKKQREEAAAQKKQEAAAGEFKLSRFSNVVFLLLFLTLTLFNLESCRS
jgi:hypothetical protein